MGNSFVREMSVRDYRTHGMKVTQVGATVMNSDCNGNRGAGARGGDEEREGKGERDEE